MYQIIVISKPFYVWKSKLASFQENQEIIETSINLILPSKRFVGSLKVISTTKLFFAIK